MYKPTITSSSSTRGYVSCVIEFLFSLMAQVKIICCKWIHGKPKWLFGVDKGKKSKIIPVNHKTSYEEFVHMVIRAHNVDTEIYDVELSYMYPKKVLLTLPQKTPPIDIGNQRQFNGFLEQVKTYAIHSHSYAHICKLFNGFL